jgi:hypothetical protein
MWMRFLQRPMGKGHRWDLTLFVFFFSLVSVSVFQGIVVVGGFLPEALSFVTFAFCATSTAFIVTLLIEGVLLQRSEKPRTRVVGNVLIVSTVVGLGMYVFAFVAQAPILTANLIMLFVTAVVALVIYFFAIRQRDIPKAI